jgi:hypothetical protein
LPYTHRKFQPLVTALGQFNLAWNDLHVSLSMLFCCVMGGGNVSKYLAVWQNIPSDRVQREVLKAVAENDFIVTSPRNQLLLDGIRWICREATTLEDLRNNAIHSPFWANTALPAAPMVGLGHLRAKRLAANKNLLAELRWGRDAATVLRNFAMEIDQALSGAPLGPWPKIPKLPLRPQTRKIPKPNQKPRVKTPPPPEPSQA